MIDHGQIPAPAATHLKGKKSAVEDLFSPPFEGPAAWVLGKRNCPIWISAPYAELSPWMGLVQPPYGSRWRSWSKAKLSALLSAPEVWVPVIPRLPRPHHGYGRPRLRQADRALVLYAAWLRDIRGAPYSAIARELGLDEPPRSDDDARKMAKRYVREGRTQLYEEGALPWMVWPAGELPSSWWQQPELVEALSRWHQVGCDVREEIVKALVHCASVFHPQLSSPYDETEFRVSPWDIARSLQEQDENKRRSRDVLSLLQVRIIYGLSRDGPSHWNEST